MILTEQTDWIGGQLTSQAVPPDEHPWIEQFGCTRSYREYRERVREYYRRRYPLTAEAERRRDLNPGNGVVSKLTHEFRVSVAVLEAMLAQYVSSGQLRVFRQHVPTAADVQGDYVRSVTVTDTERQSQYTISAPYFVDATELGELLPLAGAEFVTGAEAQSTTGEMHAPATARPAGSQAFTFCFAMDYLEGEDHRIEKPPAYEQWRDYVPALSPAWTGKLFDWTFPSPVSLKPNEAIFAPNPGGPSERTNLWTYRRIADRTNFRPGSYRSDITLVNWPQNDFWKADLVTCPAGQKDQLLQQAKQMSLSFLYWMQTDAPGPNGRSGWKGLRLRRDIVGTADGLAKHPYVRESRRIEAEFRILEQHVGAEMRRRELRVEAGGGTAAKFRDTVGIGSYRIDLHPCAGGRNYIDVESLPFQIPLGALIPKRVENLLAGAKNIGTTHVTNGCYRLHPVEWNIGEAAGALAAYCVRLKEKPRGIRNKPKMLEAFQASLRAQGFELEWPWMHTT